MKISTLFAATMVLTVLLYCTQVNAQSSGIAADKQKQENLEKNKAHQAELKKKYNSLTPEQAAEAKKRANEYKKGGYKEQTGKSAKTDPKTNPAPATKPAVKSSTKSTVNSVQPIVNPVKPTPIKPATNSTGGTAKPAPIFLDANGKPVDKNAPPAPPTNKTVLKMPTPPKNSAEKAPTPDPNKK